MTLMKTLATICFVLIATICFAADSLHVYPGYWWTGMKSPRLQLMLHGMHAGNIRDIKVSYPGVKIEKIHQADSKNYLFIDLLLSSAIKPGRFEFTFTRDGKRDKFSYELKSRENSKQRNQGVTSDDIIYLIMPDRFANGDPSNDRYDDLLDSVMNRKNPLLRHGGDLKGITNNLDYIKDLGITSIWLCPVIENNMPTQQESAGRLSGYHGYWFTNHYQVDRRYGGNDAYLEFVNAAHSKGLKIVQDAVYNHIGATHFFAEDMPFKDWINVWPGYQNTNHREEVFIDPHASADDKKVMIEGWFTPHLPDLNLRNPFLANYLIQNTLWITAHFGIDAWRVDTYKYCDEAFLNRLNSALEKEFPHVTSFGEAWVNTVTASAYFTRNTVNFPFKHNMQGITDFPLNFAMLDAIRQNFGWTEGLNRLYMTLSQDALYQDPLGNCIFLDNHDMDRFYSVTGENLSKFKMGITWLLTLRGIPQLYYGTEILMKNFKNPSDAIVREDFPGGWPGDPVNKFTRDGRTTMENEAWDFIKTLADYRRTSSPLKKGKLQQFIPTDGIYVYFRYDSRQTVMIVSNSNDEVKTVDAGKYAERTKGFTKARDIVNGKQFEIRNITVPSKSALVLELVK